MKKNHYCVIMAGGVGSRFWPLSRHARPKQFLDIPGIGKSFIRHTYERFARIIPPENFLVVTHQIYVPLVLEQLPELSENQILGEPIARNTAPCIAYAAYRLRAQDPGATMIVTPSDHLILNEEEFICAIGESIEYAEAHPVLMTIGIRPTRPDTGYGYIQAGECRSESCTIMQVKTFTEKPNLEMAQVFLDSGDFYWNSGIFVWKTETILNALQNFLPETEQLFESIRGHYNTPNESSEIEKVYSQCRGISIDFGVMEKAENVCMRSSDFGWSDIGAWSSLYQHFDKDAEGNVTSGQVVAYDTRNCMIVASGERLAVVEGLKDYIVVMHDDVLMICPKTNEQNIKKYIDDLKYKKLDRFI